MLIIYYLCVQFSRKYISALNVSTDENQNETKMSSTKEEKGPRKVGMTTSSEDSKAEEKMSIVQKFKLMYKQYWYVLIPVHVVTSIVWYGSFFIAAKR